MTVDEQAEPASSAFFFSFLLFVALAPLYKASNRPLPLLLLELAAIGFLLVLARGGLHSAVAPLPGRLLLAIGLLLGYPLLQCIPLPEAIWRELPGHADYAALVARFAPAAGEGWNHAVSIVPAATERGWLALLPPLACFLCVQRLSPRDIVRLLLAMAIIAGLESLLGLLQVRAARDSIFYILSDVAHGTAAGTFVNHNHFAAMLAMMLPVVVGLLVYSIRFGRRRLRPATFSFDPDAASQRVLLFLSALLLMLCLFFTGSRAGIASALVGLAGSSILFTRARSGVRHASAIVAGLVAMAIAVAALIGLSPLLGGLTVEQLGISGAGRLALAAATLRAAIEFLPFGSGLSTFADVFPRYQLEVFGGYIDHAHNDYLQFFMETGVVAPVVVGLLLASYVIRTNELLRRDSRRSFIVLQLAAAIALLPLIVHSLFDFALHMPANAMWYATLCGIVFHQGVQERTRERHPRPRPARKSIGPAAR